MIPSVTIVRWPKGYVAHLRYANPRMNADLSHFSKYLLYEAIERHIGEKQNEV